jgi:sugar phosphate isomerase/epimerase
MQINFNEILKALKQIGYCGYFTLEARKYLRAYTAQTALDGLQALADSARRLAALYESED